MFGAHAGGDEQRRRLTRNIGRVPHARRIDRIVAGAQRQQPVAHPLGILAVDPVVGDDRLQDRVIARFLPAMMG